MSPSFEAAFAPTFKRVVETPQEVAPVLGYLMTPIALGAYVLGFWRLGADLGWMGEFFISRGLFSHWQVWLALGIGIQSMAAYLVRLGRNDGAVLSQNL